MAGATDRGERGTGPAEAGAAYDLPPLVWLRAFEAAARHSSFTAAAAELNLTQAAVSHQVRSLERHLGVTLFERGPRNLRLTERGSAYLPPLRRSFDDLAAATAGLFGPMGRRALVIRAPVSFVTLWLAPRLPSFAAAHPGIAIRMINTVWDHVPVDESCDVDIRYGDGLWPGHQAERILGFPAMAVCRPDRLPPGSPEARLPALAAQPLLHVTGYEDLWQRLLRPAGIVLPPYSGFNIDTSIGALELAAAGYGPAIVQTGFAERYLADGRLVVAWDATLPLPHAHYLLTQEAAKRPQPEALLVRTWLRAEARAASGG